MRALSGLVITLIVVGGVAFLVHWLMKMDDDPPEQVNRHRIPEAVIPDDARATYTLLTQYRRLVGDLLIEDGISPIMSQARRDDAQRLVDRFDELE